MTRKLIKLECKLQFVTRDIFSYKIKKKEKSSFIIKALYAYIKASSIHRNYIQQV